MSPITEGIPSLPLRRCEVHLPPTGTRPVTAAPSDESVAADSGVFDASQENLKATQRGDFDEDSVDTAQMKLGLSYDVDREALIVCIDQAKGLKALGNTTQNKEVFAKAVLLPSSPSESCVMETKRCDYQDNPVFEEQFHIPVPEVRGQIWPTDHWLINWLPDDLNDRFLSDWPLTDWLTTDWLTDCFTHWLSDWLSEFLIDFLTCGLTHCRNPWLIACLAEWLTDLLTP